MKPIHAHFENGIFRPTEHVELPEHCEVVFFPEIYHMATQVWPWHPLHLSKMRSNRRRCPRFLPARQRRDRQPFPKIPFFRSSELPWKQASSPLQEQKACCSARQ
ncbi:MAG: antitoxin family protein [Thermoguttaceae bacterium]